MPAALKLAIIFTVLLGTHACAFLLRYRFGRSTASEIVFFLACLIYGAAIWLVAQIFHINAGDADGFWWWAMGVLPFALGLDTLLLHALLVGLLGPLCGFFDVRLIPGRRRLAGVPGTARRAEPTATLVLALPGLLWAYRKNSPRTVALYAPLLAWWVILQPFAWRFEANPVYFVGFVGGLFLLVAECHPRRKPAGDSLPVLRQPLLTVGALIPLSYYSFQKDLHLDVRVRPECWSRRPWPWSWPWGGRSPWRRVRSPGLGPPDVAGRSSARGEDRRRWLPLGMILVFLMLLVYWNLLVGEAPGADAYWPTPR